MRRAALTMDEALAAEKAADDRKNNRNNGYGMMHVRDKGYHTLSNGVQIQWPHPRDETKWGVVLDDGSLVEMTSPYKPVPEGKFVLKLPSGREYLFDTDEFQKWLRWA